MADPWRPGKRHRWAGGPRVCLECKTISVVSEALSGLRRARGNPRRVGVFPCLGPPLPGGRLVSMRRDLSGKTRYGPFDPSPPFWVVDRMILLLRVAEGLETP